MPLFGLGFDWRKSHAHWFLLSRFLQPRDAHDHDGDRWKEALGEPPQKAIKRFLQEGLVRCADLAETVDRACKADDLKAELKRRGLPVSGRKADLIARLIEADPEGVKKSMARHVIYRCSDQGRTLAEGYLAAEAQKRAATEAKVLDLLGAGRLEDAARTVASFEAQQVFARGMGIDWNRYDPSRDVAVLKSIFSAKPRILGRLPDESWQLLRLGAAQMHLWGINKTKELFPADFRAHDQMDNDTSARMILFYAINHQRVEEWLRTGYVKTIKVSAVLDERSCKVCQEADGKRYRVYNAPELPHPGCTSEMGCRCMLMWDVEHDRQ